jgi:hypothetical protein
MTIENTNAVFVYTSSISAIDVTGNVPFSGLSTTLERK